MRALYLMDHTYRCWQGLDIPDIAIIFQYGIMCDVLTTLQQAGWGDHSPTSKAIFLPMYEPWVKLIDLSTIEANMVSNPDHPNIPKLTKYSTKEEHTGIAMIQIVQLEQD